MAEVCANRLNHLRDKDGSKIGDLARRLKITSGKKLRKLEFRKLGMKYKSGFNTLIKLRTGCFKFTNYLCRVGVLPSDHLNTCVGCNKSVKEDIPHIMFDCSAYDTPRSKYFGKHMQSNNPTPVSYTHLTLPTINSV